MTVIWVYNAQEAADAVKASLADGTTMALRGRAAEYTVDNLAGGDANPGTAEVSFKTLAKGLSALRSGDTLHLGHQVVAEQILRHLATQTP